MNLIRIGYDIEVPIANESGAAYPATLVLPPKHLAKTYALAAIGNYGNVDLVNKYGIDAIKNDDERFALKFDPLSINHGNTFSFDHDGLPAELQVAPSTCIAYSIDLVRRAIYRMQKEVAKHKLHVYLGAGLHPEMSALSEAPPETFVSGCNVTLDAFRNGAPIDPDPMFTEFVMTTGCYTGCHIHFGLDYLLHMCDVAGTDKERMEIYQRIGAPLARALTILVTPVIRAICLSIDRNGYEAIRAAKVLPGSFRVKPYGFEYKDASSNVLATPWLLSLYAQMCRSVIASYLVTAIAAVDNPKDGIDHMLSMLDETICEHYDRVCTMLRESDYQGLMQHIDSVCMPMLRTDAYNVKTAYSRTYEKTKKFNSTAFGTLVDTDVRKHYYSCTAASPFMVLSNLLNVPTFPGVDDIVNELKRGELFENAWCMEEYNVGDYLDRTSADAALIRAKQKTAALIRAKQKTAA